MNKFAIQFCGNFAIMVKPEGSEYLFGYAIRIFDKAKQCYLDECCTLLQEGRILFFRDQRDLEDFIEIPQEDIEVRIFSTEDDYLQSLDGLSRLQRKNRILMRENSGTITHGYS